jgi:PGDYG protein
LSAGSVPLFRSSAQPGHSSFVSDDPRHVRARKLVREIDVYFTDGPCVVRTNEGVVQARPGDAIITGIAGEHWRVSRARFPEKYRPVPPTASGEAGRYLSLPNRILAVRMDEAFEVLLADGESRLQGRVGDWLVDYGDGSLGIVSPAIFATTYQIFRASDSRRPMALHQIIQRLLLIGVRLERLQPAPTPHPPASLLPLIESIEAAHDDFDRRALDYGNRYRSGFWAIYLLSAIAVMFAVLPLALGWDSPGHQLHSYAALWALGEVVVIGTVSAIYWRGHRRHWQEEWLRARTTAELAWYLPMLAPLLNFTTRGGEANWYLRVFDPGQHLRTGGEIASLCERNEALAQELLGSAWSDARFVASYTRWTMEILEQQRHYHHSIATRQRALLHRVHAVTSALFGLTALGALLHLAVHTMWLSLVTTSFPALGASLHGALAQSEAYRLGQTSERLFMQLTGAIDRIRVAVGAGAGGEVAGIKASIQAAIALILEEHQDWHLLVRPHHLPLG